MTEVKVKTDKQENKKSDCPDPDPIKVPLSSIKSDKAVSGDKIEDRVDRDRADTEYESDKGYRAITENIIRISEEHLKEQRISKQPLRKNFSVLFTCLLSIQFGFIVLFIILNAIEPLPFVIPADILKLYIISVFVETLSAMAVMITFAFVSTEETKIVGVLNNIVTNYQKVKLDMKTEKANESNKDT